MKRFRIFRLVLSLLLIFTASSCFGQGSQSKGSSFQYLKKLNALFDFIQQYYVDEVDPKVIYEGAVKGLLDSLNDPYTTYLDVDYLRDLSDTTEGTFGGVGLSITKPTANSAEKPAYVEVAYPLATSPGAKAGIQSGDFIIAVDDKPTDVMTMNEVLQNLRGPVGTNVKVTILRGTNTKFEVTLTRALIEVPTAKYGMIENTTIGYVRLIEFTPETPKRLQDALDLFASKKYTGLIIDLRDNPGGLISSVVDVADKFIDSGVIVSTKSRIARENFEYKATKEKTVIKKKMPVVVLINRGSASASEILSGALKDYHLAYLVGENTYGKGSVQQVRQLSDQDGFKYTVARYYTPSDVNIDKVGIPPDLEVINFKEFNDEESKIFASLNEDKMIETIAKENPNMTEEQIAQKAKELSLKYPLEERIIRRLIRNAVYRNKEDALYDLDYDLQLNAAIDIIKKGNFNKLMNSTKTLKELQAAAKKDENAKK